VSITLQDAQTYRGATVVDAAGEKIGTVDEIYLDRATGEPEWAAVKTGLFGMKSSFVPLSTASPAGEGELRVDVTKDQVKDAPRIDADEELSEQEEQRLYRHYGRQDYEWGGEDRTRDLGLPGDRAARFSREGEGDASGTAGRDTSGPTTDDAMMRSEEELKVGTASRERGRARLRKYVVTEQQEVTVPVQREEVRVEREPITDANVDQALDGPAISEEEHEVVLREEEPVIEKRAVPKERVRVEKDTVTEDRTVSEEVRKERIDADTGDSSR
jgi:uncharacterized protein (TIGR02271 family)